jgi:hypothetical protein
LLLLATFVVFLFVYEVYAHVLGLGGIDGLTPLPEAYWPAAGAADSLPPVERRPSMADLKLRQAFGENGPELQRLIKLDMPGKGLVLAVDDFEIQPEPNNHWVRLVPFSLAIVKPGTSGFPEINTVRSHEAFLQLDQPIKTHVELGKCKIVGGELRGDVQLVNNRGTPSPDDDLKVYTSGEVHYDERLHRVWTAAPVQLTDLQGKPEPTTVTATGMDVFLAAEAAEPGRGSPPKGKGDRPADVERVELRSNVRMDHWVEGGTGLLASGKAPAQPAAQDGEAGRAKLIITTDGKFGYDLKTDQATFDIPHRPGRHPEVVRVVREVENAAGKRDQLDCDHLLLQFRRRGTADAPKPANAAPAARTTPNLEMESARATGKALVLTSDAEALVAYGNDLSYDAAKKLTVLKGVPQTVAMKEGHEIHARELWLATGDQADGHQATAVGPGVISMLERDDAGTVARTLKATWTDRLVYHKEGPYDCLTLTGEASFEDPTHAQRLRADRLKVWLEPKGAEPKDADGARQVRPHHLEAKGRVAADSPELRIEQPTEYLVVWFQDLPARPDLPAGLAEEPGDRPGEQQGAGSAVPQGPPAATDPRRPTSPAPPTEAPKKPMILCARSVEVHVLRAAAAKNELERLWCEGLVHVHQEPEGPQDKGTDIRGETLQLNHAPDGGVLVVSGKPAEGRLAQVQLNKLAVLGPEVNIDQRSNRAWVNGEGAMQMLTDTNFDGAKLAKPTELTVTWRDRMRFDGLGAEFFGGVQATQEASRLLCFDMRVTFDQPVSLKGGPKGGPSPKVDKLLCDKEVFIEEETREGGRLLGYRRLRAPVMSLDNANKSADVPGPGVVRIFQRGGADDPLSRPAGGTARATARKPAPDNRPEFTVTHVAFRDRMQAKNHENRTATFWGDVHAVHVPSDRPDLEVDTDKLPPGCVYLRCERLRVLTHRLADGRSSEEMVGEGKVTIRANEFSGVAEAVKFDEAQDRVILEGGEGGLATLYQAKNRGGDQAAVTGKKIIYWRRLDKFRIEDSEGLTSP